MSSALPSITLVTPSFNQASYLERTIRSVIDQDYPALDWIIVDAMSTDGTAAILERYRHLPFLRIIREPDRGQTDAINKGLRAGAGHIAGWLNSDDELRPGALATVGRKFLEYPGAALIYGGGAKIDETGAVLKAVPGREFDAKLLRSAFYILQPSMYFRRALALELGGLDERLDYAMDWELALRLAQAGEVQGIPDELSALRCYANTKSETGGWERLAEIARIGRKWNGSLDRNFLAYRVRRAVRHFALGRRAADAILSTLYPARSIMVTGWPR